MKQRNKVQDVSKNTNGLALFIERVISGICLIVMFVSPLSPVFVFAADEGVATDVVSEPTATSQESTESEATSEVSTEPGVTEEVTTEIVTTDQENTDPQATLNTITTSDETSETNEGSSPQTEIVSETTESTSIDEVTSEVPLTEPLQEHVTSSIIDALQTDGSSTVMQEVTEGTTTPHEVSIEQQVVPEVPITPLQPEDTPEEPMASTTEELKSEIPEGETVTLSAVTNDQNRFVFGKSECVSAGDDTFYCTKGTSDTGVSHADRVFSAVDADGDKEIYIERNSVVTKITNNNQDDDAPYYDGSSNTLVWHRLIDGRYQIISYDLVATNETQITHDRFNNMEPHRYGETTVWQGWIGNDWEIMMLKGDELTMLTDNTTHDITPSINGDHIVWQSFEGDSWKMKVYDTRTKETQTIEDSAGGSIENPRFVLVYDTKLESGDVETRGFNLETGEVVSLGAKPAPVPEDIPDPDQTGEKRALVTPPTQPKTKIDENDDLNPDGASGEPPLNPDETVTDDLVIPPLVFSDDEGTTTDAVSTSTIPDLTVSVQNEATSLVTHIDDLIIPRFESPTSTLEDSQVPIVPVS